MAHSFFVLPRVWQVIAVCLICTSVSAQELQEGDVVLEELPEDVVATMEARDQWLAALPQGGGDAFDFFVVDVQRWLPGSTVKVAFMGGNPALHKKIADATKNITDNCNLRFDFGHDPTSGTYRTWSTSDGDYKAEIRVAFDQAGNFSLVGQDSINASIGNPINAVGGRPGQRSLNLGGYDLALPADWKRTVRHEFLHAIAFKHEHQSPLGACDSQFRWENDPGYIPKQDSQGRYVANGGKRPGIYTYLSGFPNFWTRAKVDHNMRQVSSNADATVGSFDRASIMLYRFPNDFYVSSPNSCQPAGGTDELSAGDIEGLHHLYPLDDATVADVTARKEALYEKVRETDLVEASVKSGVLSTLQADQNPKALAK